MKALHVELRLVHSVDVEDLPRLPKGQAPQAVADAAWNVARLVAALIRQHVPADAQVYILTGLALESGSACIPDEVESV
ncbi:MAG TPA: hypothetical protein VFD43_09070 [Planctomycetota bacterium]|nr:hypothetical protein [Planctomycetota bacterium]